MAVATARAYVDAYERFPQASEAVFVTAERFEEAMARLGAWLGRRQGVPPPRSNASAELGHLDTHAGRRGEGSQERHLRLFQGVGLRVDDVPGCR